MYLVEVTTLHPNLDTMSGCVVDSPPALITISFFHWIRVPRVTGCPVHRGKIKYRGKKKGTGHFPPVD